MNDTPHSFDKPPCPPSISRINISLLSAPLTNWLRNLRHTTPHSNSNGSPFTSLPLLFTSADYSALPAGPAIFRVYNSTNFGRVLFEKPFTYCSFCVLYCEWFADEYSGVKSDYSCQGQCLSLPTIRTPSRTEANPEHMIPAITHYYARN